METWDDRYGVLVELRDRLRRVDRQYGGVVDVGLTFTDHHTGTPCIPKDEEPFPLNLTILLVQVEAACAFTQVADAERVQREVARYDE